MAISHAALTNGQILTWTFVFSSHIDFSGFHSDTVITYGKIHTGDLHIMTGLRVQAIRIRRYFWVDHRHIQETQVIGKIWMDVPAWTVLHPDALNGHIGTMI